jgi:hypothetical protein
MSEDAPRSYPQRAMRFPPRRTKRSRSHSSALLDNGSPNNANRRPARPIFELNLWYSWLTQKRSSMISSRPVVEDGVSSRRERVEICFSKTRVAFEFWEVFSRLPPRSARVSLRPKGPPQWGLRYRSRGLSVRRASCGFGRSADWHSRRSSISQRGLRSALIALRSYPSRACI